ncbi:MAG: hypothetical protein ACR2OU_19010 [Thermomicrobiales bacterium]
MRSWKQTGEKMVAKEHLEHEPAPAMPGKLFAPMEPGDDISGGWKNTSAFRTKKLAGPALAELPVVALVRHTIRRTSD